MNLRVGTLVVIAAGFALLALFVRQPSISTSAAVRGRDSSFASNPEGKVAGSSTPVLVELFTSEGCSSCPPADALLSRLGRTQPVQGADAIVLEEHVDYWDRLGWKDPFSSEVATARQAEYGEAFGGNQVYTPQMIVDGRAQFVGNAEGAALRAIRTASQAAKPAVQLSWEPGDVLAIKIEPLGQSGTQPDNQAELYLAVAENRLRSDVKRGENAGRALVHDGVVRQLTMMGNADPTSMKFSSTVAIHAAPEWNRANLRAVVFAQERRSRRVLAASAIPFPM